MHQAHKLNGEQIENILVKLVPIVAAPEDHEFFKGVLSILAEESSSGSFAHFVNDMLKHGGAA